MARQPFAVGALPAPSSLDDLAVTVRKRLTEVQRAMTRPFSAQTLTANTTLPDGTQTEHVLYRCDATGGAFTVTLPPSATSADTYFTLKRISAGSAVTWLCQGTDTVDGASTGTLASQYAVLRLYCRSGGFDVV